MKKNILLLFFAGSVFFSGAQERSLPVWQDPSVVAEGKWRARPEFISYEARDHADRRNPDRAVHYLPLKGKWRVNYSTAAEGGERDFYKPRFSVAGWGETEVPNFVMAPAVAAKKPLDGLVPPLLPEEVPLVQYRAEIDVPYIWLDRDMFVHIEGVGGAHTLYINDHKAGYSEDSRTPAQYNISDYVTDGLNSIGIEVYGYSTGSWMETLLVQPVAGTLGSVYVFSQPKLRIEDFVISPKPDTSGNHTWVDIQVVLSNSYRGQEDITLGYDIYSPANKLITYNLIESSIPASGCDTVYFREILYNTKKEKMFWTPEDPKLYKVMLYIRRGKRITEYVPLSLGLKWEEVRGGELYINDRKAELRPVNYDAAPDKTVTVKELAQLKKQKINTVYVGYPQPHWFYDVCDSMGFYVVDQANINSGFRTHDRTVGGAVANDPRFLPAFLDRTKYMQGRSKNHVSVIALSMGGNSGNGYNFYKAFQWLNVYDTLHPVIYRDVQGEWNSEMDLPQGVDAMEYLR